MTYKKIFDTYTQKYRNQSDANELIHERNAIRATLKTFSAVSYASAMGSLFALLGFAFVYKAIVIGASFFLFFETIIVVYFLHIADDAISALINAVSKEQSSQSQSGQGTQE